MGKRNKRIFVMMSGGVDSSVAAALLKEQGFEVVGVFMKNWGQSQLPASSFQLPTCRAMEDERDARRVATKIGVPFYALNFEREYWHYVFEPFLQEIKKGKTPNPDVFCNEYIKFGAFLERALLLGADFVATGHYARIQREFPISNYQFPNIYKLLTAKDRNKDQTYFLYRLNQFQLSKTLFPIGDYTKPEVRAMAKKWGLPTFDKPDSQGICFVGEEPFRKFLSHYIPQNPGVILNKRGENIGQHRGAAFYTIGQRRGLGIGGASQPLFVGQKDARANTLIAVPENDPLLYTQEIMIRDIHWISGKAPKLPLRCKARIRYRQELQKARIMKHIISPREKWRSASGIMNKSKFLIQFNEAQRAVTPGQSTVFYKGEEVLGGGVILWWRRI